MRDSQFLYGDDFDATALRELTIEQYLWRKIHASEELVELLQQKPLYERDMFRINLSLQSQRHNRKLLDELYARNNQ